MIYSIVNLKGGVGKTTTAAALWAGLGKRGYRTLAIDLDPQQNLTYNSGAGESGKTVLSLLTREASAEEAIQHTDFGDIIAASKALAGADAFLVETGKEYRLKEALEPIEDNYDYIIIDCPPSLGALSVNALTVCNKAIAPSQADYFSLQGIEQLAETVKSVKKYCNHELEIMGILMTRYNDRTVLTKNITKYVEQISDKLNTKLFETKIREGIAIKEAQLSQQSIFDYAPSSNVAADYKKFIEELLVSEKEQ